MTIGDRLRDTRGFGPGFDFVRIMLAVAVLVWHSFAIIDGSVAGAKNSIFWALWYANLPMFFALSGFLVMRSALALPMRDYFFNRLIRIIPALVGVVFAGALLIGPAITTLPPGEYLTDPATARYLLNAVGLISFELPGVFTQQPVPAYNGSLWTIPYELAYYVVIAALMSLGVVRRAGLMVAIIAGYSLLAIAIQQTGFRTGLSLFDRALTFAFLHKGTSLVPSFMAGSCIYLMRDRIPFDGRLAGACLLYFVLAGIAGEPGWFDNNIWVAISCLPLAYLVVWLGLCRLPRLPVFQRGDFSYGIYLWHFPLLNLFHMLQPMPSWWALSAAAFPAVLMAAILSWFLIEKPAMALRKRSSLGARSHGSSPALGDSAAQPAAE